MRGLPRELWDKERVSTHGRHAHPAVRNTKRREMTDTLSRDHINRLWSEEEVTLLRELVQKYKDHEHPNLEICKFLISRTAEQIKNNRKWLRMIGEEASPQEGAQMTGGGCDLADPSSALPASDIIVTSEESICEWHRNLANKIEKSTEVPPSLSDIDVLPNNIWCESKDNRDQLIMKIEKFVGKSLYEALLKHNEDGNNISNEQKLSNKSNNMGTKKINR